MCQQLSGFLSSTLTMMAAWPLREPIPRHLERSLDPGFVGAGVKAKQKVRGCVCVCVRSVLRAMR